jgi:hypothetical protein
MDLFDKFNEINKLKAKYNIDIVVVYNRYNNMIQLAIRNLLGSRNATIRMYINQYNRDILALRAKYNSDVVKINALPLPPISGLKKKALLIGINYPGSPYPLSGCLNDIGSIEKIIVEKLSFQSVVKLHDSSTILPTKVNIISQLTSLLYNSKAGDILFFHYSGHGSQIKDTNGDEADGLDEVIIPIDYFSNRSVIIDDEIQSIVQTNLKEGVKLFVLMDCCHSGTIFDLKYNYDANWNSVVNAKSLDTKGDIIVISGCSDTQSTYDTQINNLYQGTTTWTFTQCLKPNITWKQLIVDMRKMLVDKGLSVQVPQISTGRSFDINAVVI